MLSIGIKLMQHPSASVNHMSLHQPQALCELGRRKSNQDYIFPLKGHATSADRLFVVCDGVGGAPQGEVASRLATDSWVSYYRSHCAECVDSERFWNAALQYTQTCFDTHIRRDARAQYMATTLTFLLVHSNGVVIGHIGDSRIYHIRNGNILFQTADHSAVNLLVQQGLITPQEARAHPERNIVTKVVRASAYSSEDALDVHMVETVQAGDYFLLCTDGVVEALDNDALTAIIASQQSDSQKIAHIRRQCTLHSHDNFSAYLIHIAAVEK